MKSMTIFKDNIEFSSSELLPIITLPNPILKKVATPVNDDIENLHSFINNMLFTMYCSPGIGLAAPQVGVSKRLFVMDIDYDREEITKADGTTEFHISNTNPLVFINPIIEKIDGEIVYQEGCLSVPGIYEDVKRIENIIVHYEDIAGNKQSINASGLLSVCIQHENDHLDGIVFLERLSLLKKNLLTKKFLKSQKKKGL